MYVQILSKVLYYTYVLELKIKFNVFNNEIGMNLKRIILE